jgi:hypothetical protein
MDANRHDTLFSLRYAVRVLERYARLWHRLDVALRVIAIFFGTAAFGALMAQSGLWAAIAGLLFAFLQALEYGVGPARREQEARSARALYAEILARQRDLSNDDLESEYQKAISRDPVIVPDGLRHLAYNDIVDERGCDPRARYELSRLERALAVIA